MYEINVFIIYITIRSLAISAEQQHMRAVQLPTSRDFLIIHINSSFIEYARRGHRIGSLQVTSNGKNSVSLSAIKQFKSRLSVQFNIN